MIEVLLSVIVLQLAWIVHIVYKEINRQKSIAMYNKLLEHDKKYGTNNAEKWLLS